MITNYQCFDCQYCIGGEHTDEYYCAFYPGSGRVNYNNPAFAVMKNDPACDYFKKIQ